MKFLSICLSLLMALQMSCYTAASAQVSFAGDVIAGQAPINKVGMLLLTEGIAVMTATTLEIRSKGPDGTQQSQLQGQIFKTKQDGNTIRGEVYFDRGPGLAMLDRRHCEEYLKMIDGTKVSGAITEVTASGITCARRTVPMNEIAEVHSPRVFQFTTTVGEKPRMQFESTCAGGAVVTKAKQNRSSGDSKIAGGKVILVGAVVAVVACAIALPIAIPAAYKHHHNHKKNTKQINQYVYGRSGPVRGRSGGYYGGGGYYGAGGSSGGSGPGA